MRKCVSLIFMATSLLAQPSSASRLLSGNNANWVRFSEGGISVEMPGTPEAFTSRHEYDDAVATAHNFRYNKGPEKMLVSYMEFDRDISDVGYLKAVRDYFAGGRPMLRDKDILVGGYHGKWMKTSSPGKVSEAILVIVGRRVYQAYFQAEDTMTGTFDSPRFFGTFRVNDLDQSCGFRNSSESGIYASCERR